jgi:hypothetical protein
MTKGLPNFVQISRAISMDGRFCETMLVDLNQFELITTDVPSIHWKPIMQLHYGWTSTKLMSSFTLVTYLVKDLDPIYVVKTICGYYICE